MHLLYRPTGRAITTQHKTSPSSSTTQHNARTTHDITQYSTTHHNTTRPRNLLRKLSAHTMALSVPASTSCRLRPLAASPHAPRRLGNNLPRIVNCAFGSTHLLVGISGRRALRPEEHTQISSTLSSHRTRVVLCSLYADATNARQTSSSLRRCVCPTVLVTDRYDIHCLRDAICGSRRSCSTTKRLYVIVATIAMQYMRIRHSPGFAWCVITLPAPPEQHVIVSCTVRPCTCSSLCF